jgi:hypothetical protein
MKKNLKSSLTGKALAALQVAVAKAVAEHRRRGMPVAIWRDGRAVSIPAAEAGALHEMPTPYRSKSHGKEP